MSSHTTSHEPALHSIQEPKAVNGSFWWSWRMRLVLLVAILALETLLLFSLQNRGWVATTNSTRWLVTLLAALLPLLVAALLLFGNGFRFKLRTMLLGITSVCIFLTVSLSPLLRARQARSASQQLQLCGIEFSPISCSDVDYDHQVLFEHNKKFSGPDDIPSWLLPLAGGLESFPRDVEIVAVTLKSDEQIQQFVANVTNLGNIRELGISSAVTDDGLRSLAAAAPQLDSVTSIVLAVTDTSSNGVRRLSAFKHLRYLLVSQVTIPNEDWLGAFRELETLLLWDERFTSNPNLPNAPKISSKTFRSIAALPELRVLTIRGFDLTDVDMQQLVDASPEYVRIHCRGFDVATLPDFNENNGPRWIVEHLDADR